MELKYYLPLALLNFGFTGTYGQIQLSSNDVYSEGSYQMGIDPNGSFNLETPGENKTWDFSSLQNLISYDFKLAPYSGNGNGNEANIAKVEDTDTFEYIKKTGSAIYLIHPINNFAETDYYSTVYFQFPGKYDDKNQDSFSLVYYYDASVFGITDKDSVRLLYNMHTTSVADAWGTLKLPNGDFNTLRIKNFSTHEMWMEGKSGNDPYEHVPGFDYNEETTDYTWYAKDKGYYIASYNEQEDEMRYMVSGTVGLTDIQESKSNITFSNPIGDELVVKNPDAKAYDISILDASGKLLISGHLTADGITKIDTKDLPCGFYYFNVIDQFSGKRSSYKLLK